VGEFTGAATSLKGGGFIGGQCVLAWTLGEFPTLNRAGRGKGAKTGTAMPYFGTIQVDVVGLGIVTVEASTRGFGQPLTLVDTTGERSPIEFEITSPAIFSAWVGGGDLTLIGAMADVSLYSSEDTKHTFYFTLSGFSDGEGIATYELYTDKNAKNCIGTFTGDFIGAGGGTIGIPGVNGFKANMTWTYN
jgi:hypothetical protein